jgi:putative FmdB family regulatory protein
MYRFQCFECGFQFDANAPMSERHEKKPCPSCGSESERLMPDGVNGFFEQDVTGPVPQNTGISQIDADIDRTIGASAKKGWDAHKKRVEEKRRVQAQPEAEGKPLSRNPDGSYRPMEDGERAVQARALNIHDLAMKQRSAKNKPPTQ